MSKKNLFPIDGWLFLDKPSSVSSNQALQIVKREISAQKAGYAGTLDPFATGLLPIAFGHATKMLQYLQNSAKIYEFTIEWGIATDSLDCTGTIVAQDHHPPPNRAEIEAILPQFLGKQQQIPPQYSALKIDGNRAYKLARAGEAVDLPARAIEIFDLKLLSPSLSSHPDQIRFLCHCSKGTYIRALVRDIGEKLGRFCTTKSLRRIKIGKFSLNHAILLDESVKFLHKHDGSVINEDNLQDVLYPVEWALDGIQGLYLTEAEAAFLYQGRALSLYRKCDFARIAAFNHLETIKLLVHQNLNRFKSAPISHLIGLGQYKEGQIIPLKMLHY